MSSRRPEPTSGESLVRAIIAGDGDLVASLLARGVSPDSVDDEGVPALLHAADRGSVELVDALVAAGGQIDAVDDIGATLLSAAIDSGSIALVEYLIDRGIDVDRGYTADVDGGPTPLTAAAGAGVDPAIVTALLAAGADANLPRLDGWTPLMIAAQAGRLDAVEALLAAGADVRAAKKQGDDRVTALDIARHWKHEPVVSALEHALDAGPGAR